MRNRAAVMMAVLCNLVLGATNAIAQNVLYLGVERITSFDLQEGQPAWENGIRQRLLAGVWKIASNGACAYKPGGGGPMIVGRCSADGQTMTMKFEGSATTGSSVGVTVTTVSATLDPRAGTITMRSATRSAMGAVVDGQRFAQSNVSAYTATLSVMDATAEQIRAFPGGSPQLSAVVPPPIAMPAPARSVLLSASRSSVDFGTVIKGRRVSRRVTIANDGDVPATIEVARSACRCLFYRHDGTVPAHGTAQLTVTLDGARAARGTLDEWITVRASSSSTRVRVHGVVR